MLIKDFLRLNHIGDEAVYEMVAALGIETRDDLAFYYTAKEQAGCLAPVWLLARGYASASASSLACEVVQTTDRVAGPSAPGGSRALHAAFAFPVGTRAYQRRCRGPSGPGGTKAQDPTAPGPGLDREQRRKVASELVGEAHWLPVGAAEEVLEDLAEFEVQVLRQRQRAWRRWKKSAHEQGYDQASAPVSAVRAFLAQQTSPTAPGALWDALRWMHRHVRPPWCFRIGRFAGRSTVCTMSQGRQ